MSRRGTVPITLATAAAGAAALVLLPSPAWAASTATLIATHSTAAWNVPSPDPDGITYDSANHRLVISDSEVDETPLYHGTNVFFASLKGAQSATNVGWTTEPWSFEPTGINRLSASLSLISDDDKDRVFQVKTGTDGRPVGTPTGFTTRPGNGDPEDVAKTTANGHIVTVDGVNDALYDYGPGPDGVFDGVAPAGDDTRQVIDLSKVGASDPEGVAYYAQRNAFLVVDRGSKAVYELTRTGGLINKIGIAAASPHRPAGIVLAPASDGSGRTDMYIVDRGVDNNTNPSENDGRLYELRAGL
jgi:hypothetical protein